MPVLETFHAQRDRRGLRLELTPTHVRQVVRRWGVYHCLSLPLPQVTSINYSARMPVGCLLLALLAGLAALLCVSMAHFGGPAQDRWWWQGSIYLGGLALIVLGAFQLARQQELTITTATDRIVIQCSASEAAALREFSERVEQQQAACLAGDVAAPPLPERSSAPPSQVLPPGLMATGRRPRIELPPDDKPPAPPPAPEAPNGPAAPPPRA